MKPELLHGHLNPEYETSERCWITELSNNENDPDVSIARARVEPGVTTAWHRLRDTAERYVILEGLASVEISDTPPTAIGIGDCAIIPPGCRQRITNTGKTDLIFLAICSPRFRAECYEDLESPTHTAEPSGNAT